MAPRPMAQESPFVTLAPSAGKRGRVWLYLLLTFALSWGFELLVALTIGHRAFLDLGLAPWSMFVPAAAGFALQLFAFRDSPDHVRSRPVRAILLPVSFLLLTVIYGLVTGFAIGWPSQSRLLGGIGNILTTLWTLLVFALYGQVGSDGFKRVGLRLGDVGRGLPIALGSLLFLLTQAGLSLVSGTGSFPGLQNTVLGIAIPQGLYPLALVLGLVLSMSGIPLAGLAPTFGEEYGWRGLLLGAWLRHGKRRAALLTGLVWGVWHIPVILGGIHTYPPTLVGVLLGLIFFVLWGVVQSYAVLATGSLWVAAFLHGLVNSVYSFAVTYLAHPQDRIWSFGLGVYGLLSLAPIVFVILQAAIWKKDTV